MVISEYPALYRNANVVRVYLHACLTCGYHDDDRDVWTGSIRATARSLGISVGATRHAIAVLERTGLLQRGDGVWLVKKYELSRKITPRAQDKAVAKESVGVVTAPEPEEMEAPTEKEARLRETRRKTLEYIEGIRKRAKAGDPDAIISWDRWKKTYNTIKESL